MLPFMKVFSLVTLVSITVMILRLQTLLLANRCVVCDRMIMIFSPLLMCRTGMFRNDGNILLLALGTKWKLGLVGVPVAPSGWLAWVMWLISFLFSCRWAPRMDLGCSFLAVYSLSARGLWNRQTEYIRAFTELVTRRVTSLSCVRLLLGVVSALCSWFSSP